MGDTTNQIAALIDNALDPAATAGCREQAAEELITLAYNRLVRLCSTNLRKFTTLRFLPNDTGDVLDRLPDRVRREWPRFLDDVAGMPPAVRPQVWFGWCGRTVCFVLRDLGREAGRGVRGRSRPFPVDDEGAAFDPPDSAPEPPELIADNEVMEHLHSAIRELPIEQREPLELRVFHELTFPEIGDLLGVSEDVARRRYNKAVLALRGRFGDRIDWHLT